MKFFKTLCGSLFILGLLLPGFAFKPPVAEAADENFDVSTCPWDYYQFLYEVQSKYMRRGYIKDLFTMSYCQVNDIMFLNDELKLIRDNFRSAAFDCADTSSYKEAYKETKLEIYFIRNVQKTTNGLLDEKEIEDLEAKKALTLEKLYDDMYAIFVTSEKYVTEKEFDGYFDVWSQQYDDRIGQYARCDEGPWSELEQTWNSFIEDMQNIKFEIEPPETKSFKDIVTPDVSVTVTPSTIDTFESMKKSFKLRSKEVPEADTVKDIIDKEGILNIGDALDKLSDSAAMSEIAYRSAERMSRYEYLYGQGGALAASNMQGLLQTLNATVMYGNIKQLPAIEDAVVGIFNKQCN